ncbi:glycoside hydrolase family 5 protein [Aspergillus mulundensis]|uniref:cellulase n=1 Tax=Aspergillus mulundensis TaxID=1810919 RepID=A0A3D8R4X8_9EURO|nr:Endo-beta-1,4-glucanase B [Aspergillus mulundensis]RDW69037.1 Endo-beta-1,4-glucanase B [Aspergillus mulundensis]
MKLNTLLVAAAAGTAMAAPQLKKRSSGFTFFGVSESGAEFGESNIPGVWNTDYIFPDTSAISTLISKGFNSFRIPFLMERLTPEITGSFDEGYLQNLTSVVDAITSAGAWAILDPHNYGRFNGEIISTPSDFKTWWQNVATQFADNKNVIFDTNNEYHDMDQTLVLNLNQAAINGIRAAGATTQYIFVEGNSYTGAWTWTENNDNLKSLTDPQDKIVYEMHQYLDSDGSGTSETCVSSTIGAERVSSATQWLKENGKLGVLGEFAGGDNEQCRTAITGMLDDLKENADVWLGALWWSAGPWWGDYMYSMEPTGGVAYQGMLSTLEAYMP